LKAIAPGKIILSGEHAVVYGNSALVMAVNEYSSAQIDIADEQKIVFSLPDLHSIASFTMDEIRDRYRLLRYNYERFAQGRLNVTEIVTTPVDLFVYVYISMLDRCAVKIPAGLTITIKSTVPAGCGMGSSAATIVSLITALAAYFNISDTPEIFYDLALETENLQHGHSSGVDPYIALHGGFCRFRHKQPHRLPMPDFPFTIVNTGAPAASTGESVAQVAQWFRNSSIWKDFQAVTDAFEQACSDRNKSELTRCMRENHRLLCTIGVVPEMVQHFIAGMEKQGGAGKISGAGSVKGEQAGIVLALCEENVETSSADFGYKVLSIKGEKNGARIVPGISARQINAVGRTCGSTWA